MAVVYIDIENSIGQKQGSGPIISASKWRSVARMDKAGTFEFEMPASDPKAVAVRKKFIARAYCFVNGQRIEVGAGIIDRIQKQPQPDGKVILRVSGDDLVRELTYRSVLDLKLYLGGNPVSHATAVAAVGGYAPAGWSFTPDASPANNLIYGYFNGETVLAGMIKVAQKSLNHFYRGTGRSLVFASSFTPSGVRAIQARGELSPTTCAIVSLSEQIDTYDLITRIYPRGSGNANAQLLLRATNRVAPGGFTLNAAQNYIQNNTAIATYGVIERQIDFRDIGPISNTDADIQSASNMLFDAALETLKQRSTEIELATYTLQLAGCSQLLRPMQTIRLVYRDLTSSMDINTDLNILEATWEVNSSGIYTTGLKVSNADRWPKSDVGTIVDGIEQGNVYQALPQLNANSYVTAYNKNIDADFIAAFRFRFGTEVTQLSQVLFEYQLLPFESTVKTIAALTGTSSSGGGSTQSASSGGSHTHSVTVPSHSHTVTIPSHTHDVTIAAHTHTVTVAAHSHSVTVAGHSHTVTVVNHQHTVTVPNHTHDIPNHQHVLIVAGSGSGANVMIQASGGTGFLQRAAAGDLNLFTTPASGAVTSDSGGGSSQSSSSGGGQSVSSSTQSDTSPSSSTTAQATPSSSSGGGQTVTSSTAASATNSSSTASSSIETSSSNGTHTHTVTIPTHTHTLTPDISTVYGIFRADEGDTYADDELEYRVNGGTWFDLDTAVDAGDGWGQLDITSLVMHATTFRPLQDNNLLEIRAKVTALIVTWQASGGFGIINTSAPHGLLAGDVVEISGASVGAFGGNINGTYTIASVFDADTFLVTYDGSPSNDNGTGGSVEVQRTATIDAQLSVRNIIQAVAYA